MALPGLAPRALRPLREATPACRPSYRTISARACPQPRRVILGQTTVIGAAGRKTDPIRPVPTQGLLQQRRQQSSTATPAPTFYTEEEPGRTALYDLHLKHGGKMVEFGGYSMPVQYGDLSITNSHNWTREKCSLFDVGHMVQYHCDGPGAESLLETVTPAGLKDLAPGQSTLSALLHPVTGGIVDDCMITRLEEGPKHLFYVVTNAGNRKKDYDFFNAAIEKWSDTMNPYVQLRHLEAEGQPFGLVALQGPLSAEILGAALSSACKVDVSKWYFGNTKHITLALPSGESLPIVASRGGYTGEDGFELSIHPSQTIEATEQLLKVGSEDNLRMAGLGARDSLRLEAGMCLYGHDIDDSTTPPEAALNFIIPKHRRTADDIGFHGAETIIPQLTPVSKGGKGVSRRRVGLIVEGAPAREGAGVVSQEGKAIGTVTSGCPSPTLKKNIAMAYVEDGMHKSGTEVQVVVRGKNRKATVTKMPFVPNKFYRGAM
ncbi:Aminomethyltransferase, mitochondrial [Saxophila tyrrhenica]|uniref:Aminomethyltransferase n=1 Tax=Saxophila tyrrhenica TaxID=1690608 RepID=A0AAV9P5W5_9PEZI|nr:Aminomethyltransferase, mitochondrial [Saxophila tyrrhenica]